MPTEKSGKQRAHRDPAPESARDDVGDNARDDGSSTGEGSVDPITQDKGYEVPEATASTPKQAVVVFHGMGEQRPMGTLRSFVETVWSDDTTLVDPPDQKNEYWVKPDGLTGVHELRRITTRPTKAMDDGRSQSRRTDFFECYWADIMEGNRWSDVLSWVKPLLFRGWDRVPARVRGLWVTLCVLMFFLALAFIFKLIQLSHYLTALPDGSAGAAAPGRNASSSETLNQFTAYLDRFLDGMAWLEPWVFWPCAALGLVIFVSFVFKAFNEAEGRGLVKITILAAAIGTLLLMVPTLFVLERTVGGFVVLLPAVYLIQKVTILPLFGDVARYVQVGPNTVAERQAVRDRALDLLRDLHSSRRYDRIIVVAHSLGTIIAYDVLSILWSELGPNHRNGMSEAVRKHLGEMDTFLNDQLQNPRPQNTALIGFRRLQRELVRKMAAEWEMPGHQRILPTPRWLVTDFVTMGSPLTHAEFLMAESPQKVEQSIRERIFNTAPPVMERDGAKDPTFLYAYSTGETFPHHASMFAAMRWTNIHDAASQWWNGDVFSGPVTGIFGNVLRVYKPRETKPKISAMHVMRDVNVALYRNRLSAPLSWFGRRWFTHTLYWDQTARKKTGTTEEDHIAILREAVNLRDRTDVDPQHDP